MARYMQEAENLTQQGAREHPVESFIGKTAKGLGEFGNIVGSMAPLLAPMMGIEGGVESPAEAPPAPRKALPAAPSRVIEAGPAPDSSYVRGIPGKFAEREPAPIGRQLPPAPIQLGPAPDTSYVKGIPAEYPEKVGQTANPRIRAGVAGPSIETPKEATAAPGPKPTTRQQVGKIVDSALGVEPLNPKVPLREQLGKSADVPANPKTELEQKYPDKAVRQMVHANGEKIVQAIGKDPETLRAVHDLTRVDLRNALINSGEDMGQQTVSNSKFAGEGSIGREEAFNRLLAKGHSPREIVDLAKQPTK